MLTTINAKGQIDLLLVYLMDTTYQTNCKSSLDSKFKMEIIKHREGVLKKQSQWGNS